MTRAKGGSRWAAGWRRAGRDGAVGCRRAGRLMIWRLLILAIVASLTLAASSCTGGGRRPLDTTPPATQPADALVVYHRTGGIAGADDWVVVTADGRMTVSGKLFADYATELPEGTVAKMEKRFEGWE